MFRRDHGRGGRLPVEARHRDRSRRRGPHRLRRWVPPRPAGRRRNHGAPPFDAKVRETHIDTVFLLTGDDLGGPLRELARVIAAFHAGAVRGPEITTVGGRDALSRRWRGNLDQTRAFRGIVIDAESFDAVDRLASEFLQGRGELLGQRCTDDRMVDGHGTSSASRRPPGHRPSSTPTSSSPVTPHPRRLSTTTSPIARSSGRKVACLRHEQGDPGAALSTPVATPISPCATSRPPQFGRPSSAGYRVRASRRRPVRSPAVREQSCSPATPSGRNSRGWTR